MAYYKKGILRTFMNHPAKKIHCFVDDQSSSACIDGENQECILAFREFLESHSIAVYINEENVTHCLYHIVIGTSKQVKNIFSRFHKQPFRRLIILQEDTLENAELFAKLFNAKVAVIGNELIGQEESRVIFGFLCGSTTAVIDIRKKQPLPRGVIQRSDYWEKDKERIAKTIREIYSGNQTSKHPRVAQSAARTILISVFIYVFSHFFAVFLSIFLLLMSFLFIRHSQFTPTLLSASRLLHTYSIHTFQPIIMVFPVSFARSYEQFLSLIKKTERVFSEIVSLKDSMRPSLVFSTGQALGNTPVYSQVSRMKSKAETIKTDLSLLRADVRSFFENLPKQTKIFFPQTKTVEKKITQVIDVVDTLSKLSTIYPLLAPPGETRKYLLLFQNTTELRPTGGFIGTIGTIVVNNGSISDISVEDVYTYDGQLRGHVDPPLPIRTILQQEHWYLRDSNWDPDFEKSARQAMWFFKKSGGEDVDGVVAISLPFVEDILNAVGPIRITEVSKPITADELFPLIHKQVEENFFPGSTKKKDLVGSILRKLLEEITHGNGDQLKLSLAVTRALQNKNIQLVSMDSDSTKHLIAYRWAGTMEATQGDFLFPVEANLGVNKANAGVARSISKNIRFQSSSVSSFDMIAFTNESSPSDTGGGDYTSYTRFYYPPSVKIISIQVGDKKVVPSHASMDAKPRPYAEFLAEERAFTAIGVAFDVPSGKTVTITIEQTQPYVFGSEYKFAFRPQAGVGSIPLHINGSLPPGWSVASVFPEKNPENGKLIAVSNNFEYTTRIEQDNVFLFSFTTP